MIAAAAGALDKRGASSYLPQKIQRLDRLPTAKQKLVFEMLDGVISQSGK